jgi:hypothetical protein
MLYDYLLAIPVFLAIIIFGALIVVGNERQKRELYRIRQVAEKWAMEELRIKRGQAARQTQIPDPIKWLSGAISKATESAAVSLYSKQQYSEPEALSFLDEKSGHKYVLTLIAPAGVRRWAKKRSKKTARLGQVHPLAHGNRKEGVIEMNMLTAGLLFDIELPIAWHQLTGETTIAEKMWLYIM